MRYSEYFEKVVALSESGGGVAAEKLLREAEKLALPEIANHLVLCAKAWMILSNPDNAVRCLLEAECNNCDVRSLLEIAETYIELALHESGCRRCIKKALTAAKNEEDDLRLQEFSGKYQNYRCADGNPLYLQ